jgi:hypothetical protein
MFECSNPDCRKLTDEDYCSDVCAEVIEGPLRTPVLEGESDGCDCAADVELDALWAFGK